MNRYKTEQSAVEYYEQDLTSSVLERQSFFAVATGAIENADLLQNVLPGIQAGGFLLTIESNLDAKFRQVGLDVVAKYTDGQNIYVLLKKVTNSIYANLTKPSRLSNNRRVILNCKKLLYINDRFYT